MYATHTYFSLRSRARSAGATAGCLVGKTESKAFDFKNLIFGFFRLIKFLKSHTILIIKSRL